MLGETEKSSDMCRTASLSEMCHEQRAATSSTVTDQRRKNFFVRRSYSCFEWCTPLVNGCVDCALFNA